MSEQSDSTNIFTNTVCVMTSWMTVLTNISTVAQHLYNMLLYTDLPCHFVLMLDKKVRFITNNTFLSFIENINVSTPPWKDLAHMLYHITNQDVVHHDILFLKLNHYGIRAIALDWIKSYMVNRKQYVMYNDNSSDIRSITCGVPQGSILGPLLSLLYVNDLPNISDILFTIMFADDTSMFINDIDLKAMETQLNSELKEVSIWLQVNKLSLNVEKSCFIVCKSVNRILK